MIYHFVKEIDYLKKSSSNQITRTPTPTMSYIVETDRDIQAVLNCSVITDGLGEVLNDLDEIQEKITSQEYLDFVNNLKTTMDDFREYIKNGKRTMNFYIKAKKEREDRNDELFEKIEKLKKLLQK